MSTASFSQITLTVGRLTPNGVNMLGTGFMVANGLIATTHHVIGNETSNLVVLMPNDVDAYGYQDLSNTACQLVEVEIAEIDPLRDIAILKTSLQWSGNLPKLASFDPIGLGHVVHIFGFPHCTHGRRAFTFQKTEIGSKVLLSTSGVKSSHAVINVQARPGQSGSPIADPQTSEILGMLVGAWVPAGGGIRLGDINPYELHQTTHCISAHHIREML